MNRRHFCKITILARRSYHLLGQAVDIRIPGLSLDELQAAALALKQGGVGKYSGPGFVHVDGGPVRTWGPGLSQGA